MTPRAFASLPARSSYYSERAGSVTFAYGEIERLTGRVEIWEREAIAATAVLTGDAETLTRRIHALVAGPNSPRRRLEEEMGRIAHRMSHLKRAWANRSRRAVPFFPRIGWRIRTRFRRWHAGNKSMPPRV